MPIHPTAQPEAPVGLEFLDDDPVERPRKYADHQHSRWREDEIGPLRDKLFQDGSEFKFTKRSEVVGIDNVLTEIDQLIHWLKNSPDYQRYKARLEPGVIFEGHPGTGKTLVSRYIASASEALFINVRDFPHPGALFRDSDISDLFKRSRAVYAASGRPVVLFWDEFENAAVERSDATPEQGATVSQLTAELDGIHGKNEGILLIGCTNYIYGIDKALRRSGRMGLQIEFCAPDRIGKRMLLDHYLGKYKTKGVIDVETLSYFFNTIDTAADIEESCMEAWRQAVYRVVCNGGKQPSLTQEDIIQVFLKRLVGPPTAFINLPPEERLNIAVHEVGHAIMALVYDIPLRLITVQPGKKSLGRVITAEHRDHIGTQDEMFSDMRVRVGSIVAEAQAGLPAGTGTSADINQLNNIAARLVDYYNAGPATDLYSAYAIGTVRYPPGGGANPGIGNNVLEESDADIKALLAGVKEDGQKVMASIGKRTLWAIAERVNDEITLTGSQFRDLFVEVAGEPIDFRPENA